EEGDAIILDQQVHSSVQDAARKVQLNGVSLTIVRHNRLDDLKNKIEELSSRHNKIWYMCDGVYSMYGDVAPIKELVQLANHYKQLYLYIDDAHGMSSFGKNGTGFVLNQTELHPKMILSTGMAKAFGTMGAIFVIPDRELATKVRNCAGPLIFSGQQATSILSASTASAKIHLSGEITVRQEFLAEKINYCHRLLRKYNLPDISDPCTPIFFVGLGMMSVAMNLVKRMIDAGFYVNIAIFPAVPETCSGIRFTITLHQTLEDIENLVIALAKHFPLALKEEGRTVKDIKRAFRKVVELDYLVELGENDTKNVHHKYKIRQEKSIKNINPSVWNKLLGDRGEFTWNNLMLLEETFKDNPEIEHNWTFQYYIISDPNDKPLLATFFTIALSKDDMLAPISVSENIETIRIKEPYHLTSKAMIMGSIVTSGNHLYLDRSHSKWQEVLMLLLDKVMEEQEKENTEIILLRDFNSDDKELSDFFISHAFIKTALPDTHKINKLDWESNESFMNQFNKHRRQYLKQKVFKSESEFEVEICHGENNNLDSWYHLYENVSKKSLEVNTFTLPKKFFENLIKNSEWEVIQLKLKSDNREHKLPIAVMFCYKTLHSYSPLFVGIDYSFLDFNIYPQILWQTIKRAKALNLVAINFGFTASQNKQKFGAEPISQSGFVQMKDHYKMTLIGLMPNESKMTV
ncbi:MAG TPA: pyridoxal phosphate-dependent aminotransferase family protein, partial [Cytophagaceae bacterium]|nr:pyridoxal phosphate-dependent aminotransferase family protein [Cytophagaceae bacterium]